LRGLVNAKDLNETDYVYSDISQKFIKIEKVFNNGIKPIKKIVLSNGLELNATLEHKVFLENGEKIQVKDLNVGDKIQVILKNVSDEINNDKVYDEDISWIMGYFIGNGTYSQYSNHKRLTFTVNKQHIDVINKIERILKKYGNYVVHNNNECNTVQIQTYKGNKLVEIIGKE
jgi:predicted DNA-binding antitoxin AbrB/MazE fold protein